jgi:hypothetical protein
MEQSPLLGWESIYVVGTGAAVLIGLQFAVLLLFVGIHNACDSVVYTALQHRQGKNKREERS